MKINKTVGCNKNNQKSLVSKGNSSRHKYTKTLMGLTCGIIGLGTIATVPLMTTSCSNNNSPTYDYIGNDNMKNWKGFISGNVNDSYFQFDDSDNTCGIKDQS
jgi:hypothetical protein